MNETALYRLFGAGGKLLYAGISRRPKQRMREHATDKPWWGEVKETQVIWFASRTEAEIREQDAITEEGPLYNRQLPPWRVSTNYDSQRSFLGAYKQLRREVIACVREGGDIERVAQASGWSPVFIQKLVAQDEKRRSARG